MAEYMPTKKWTGHIQGIKNHTTTRYLNKRRIVSSNSLHEVNPIRVTWWRLVESLTPCGHEQPMREASLSQRSTGTYQKHIQNIIMPLDMYNLSGSENYLDFIIINKTK